MHPPVARGATTDGGASWVQAPALPPPIPVGAQPPPYPIPVGYVGDIEFWAPNRGLLITRGNSVVPMGLYAYDGANWHQLSTVCGGTDGRIAWAGPDEFWTIADQRPGQVVPTGGAGALEDVSLCHFVNGAVVTSYALPLDQPGSYQPMNAAACATPTDCWFGGDLESAGAFHLHWDGTNLTEVDAPQDHQIASMTVDNGQIFESVQLSPTDSYTNENPSFPPLLHVIVPDDPVNPFHSLYPDNTDPSCAPLCPPLPEYGVDTTGAPVPPDALGGFALGSDWRAGSSDPQLWAAAGVVEPVLPDGGSPHPIVLRFADGIWTQVVPNLVTLPGDESPPARLPTARTPVPQVVAAEPNESAAWIATQSQSDPNQIHVVRIEIDGTSAQVTDDVNLGSGLGVATALTCPAAADCWLATSEGWLFHLTNGSSVSQDTDPNFASVITYRPPDGGTPTVIPPVEFGVSIPPPAPPASVHTAAKVRRRKALVTHMSRARLIRGTVLTLSFTLTARAHIELVARRNGTIVAETRRVVLAPGRHTLELRLDPKRWPTRLSLQASALTSAGRS